MYRRTPQLRLVRPKVAALVGGFALVMAAGLLGCDGPAAGNGSTGAKGRPGSAGVGDPYFPRMGNGGYDVTHYGLTLDYRPKTARLTGIARITARATQNLSAFNLDLLGLRVKRVTVGGAPVRFSRKGQELTVRLRRTVETGKTFRTTVRYSGTPRTITDPDGSEEGWLRTADGALALGQPTGSMAWFPGNHHPRDKAAYDISVTVPKGLEVVSNGELARRTTDAQGRTTFQWHMARPMAGYLATVAIGRWRTTRHHTTPPVLTAVDPRQVKQSAAVLARIPEIIRWEERTFGPYPFSSAGAIVDRPEDVDYALETQTRPVFGGAPDTETLVHELAHQWFGDSVTPESWQDMWLNEGFATYTEWLWQEDHGGDSAQDIFDALYRDEYYPDGEKNAAVWAFAPARPPDAAHISDGPVYQRGAMVLHKIRQAVGDSGFHAILRGWAAAHRYGTASTADFISYVQKKARGKDLTVVWDDWLYGEPKPDKP